MQAVIDDREWALTARTNGDGGQMSSKHGTCSGRSRTRHGSARTRGCSSTRRSTGGTPSPNAGRINGSNPCSEYMHIDNSACNLASINLLTFLKDDGEFDVEGFKAAVEVIFTAQEIIVGNADYPTEKIAENSRRFRELGIGYANLGALLMAQGLPYDSDEGRAWAGSDHCSADRSRLHGLGAHRASNGAVRRVPRRTKKRCSGCSGCTGPRRRR